MDNHNITEQDERVHHRCRCLDRNFTIKEWCDYLHDNPSGGVVLNVGKFGFNINDVCLTPNTPVTIERGTCRLEIVTAQSKNGRWDYGYRYNLHMEGGRSGAGYIDDLGKGFPTEKEAIYNALLYAENKALRKIDILEKGGDTPDYDEDGERRKTPSILPTIRAFLADVREKMRYYDVRQLSLFDF